MKNAAGENLMRLVYGDLDEIKEFFDALGNKSTFEYDVHLGVALLRKSITPSGKITEFTWDAKGRRETVKTPSMANWTYSYNGTLAVPESLSDPLNQQTSFEYDERLNRKKTTDPLGQATTITYNDLDLPKEVTDALEQTSSYEWNGNADLTKLTDARGKIYTMGWDAASRRSELNWPDNVKQGARYDDLDRLEIWKPRGTGATVTNVWNDSSELTGQNWVNGGESGAITFTRDVAGRVSGASATSQTLTISQTLGYDGAGRVGNFTQTVGNITRTASATYELTGSVKTITYPAGFTIEYGRNSDGQIAWIKKDGATLASYGYDTAGRLATRTLSNGVVTTYGYDSMDRLASITVASASATLWAERYGYDAAGRRSYTLRGATVTNLFDIVETANLAS